MFQIAKLVALSLLVLTTVVSAQAHESAKGEKDGAKEGAVERREIAEDPPEAAMVPKVYAPATRFSGRTPIDLSAGIPFNNGTYGAPNPDYQIWAETPSYRPNVSEKAYPFARKDDFVSGLRESEDFVKTAIWSWNNSIAHPTEVTKPEVLEYAKASVATMQPLLDKLSAAISKADSASEGSWTSAESDARKALVDARGTYAGLHKNVLR